MSDSDGETFEDPSTTAEPEAQPEAEPAAAEAWWVEVVNRIIAVSCPRHESTDVHTSRQPIGVITAI